MEHWLKDILLVHLRPGADGQLGDLQAGGAQASHVTIHHVLVGLHVSYCASEVLVPWFLDGSSVCVCVCVCACVCVRVCVCVCACVCE